MFRYRYKLHANQTAGHPPNWLHNIKHEPDHSPAHSGTPKATQCEFSLKSHMHGEFFGLTDFWRPVRQTEDLGMGRSRCPTRADARRMAERSSSQPYPHAHAQSASYTQIAHPVKTPSRSKASAFAASHIATCDVLRSVLRIRYELRRLLGARRPDSFCLEAGMAYARHAYLLPHRSGSLGAQDCCCPSALHPRLSGFAWLRSDFSGADDRRLMMPCQTPSSAIKVRVRTL